MKYFIFLVFLFFCFFSSCTQKSPTTKEKSSPMVSSNTHFTLPDMERDELYDKIYGMLLGTAIGDAMGAPTEMWPRLQMQLEYGHIQKLDSMVREPSGEGTWDYNLPAGSTTDDTRWKALLIEFLTQSQQHQAKLDAKGFARFLMNKYERDIEELKAIDSYEPEPFEAGLRKMNWLQEWAIVAKAYDEGDIDKYSETVHKFYGGEMVCGGMLFAPALGAYYPGDPMRAYEETYRLNIFDIGYGKDIGGLTAAMVSAAMVKGVTPESVVAANRDIDPKGYFKSRLVGRTAYKLFQEARQIAHTAQQAKTGDIDPKDLPLALPLKTKTDSIYYAQLATAYKQLDQKLERYPFHPAEIHLVNLTAILFADFDFMEALKFVINYGRDNDTTGAVTGSILGAYHGANGLPPKMVKKVLDANKALGFDLAKMAEEMTNVLIRNS